MRCFDSLEVARRGRSLDIVIWYGTDEAAAIDAALMRRWGRSVRGTVGDVIIYHLPRASGRGSIPAFDLSIPLQNVCRDARPR